MFLIQKTILFSFRNHRQSVLVLTCLSTQRIEIRLQATYQLLDDVPSYSTN